MLEKKLEEAARQQLIILFTSVVILTLGALAVYVILQYDFRASAPMVESGGEKESSPDRPDKGEQITAPVVPEQPVPPPAAPGETVQAHSRDEVVQALGVYEQDFEPTISAAGFAAWNAPQQAEFTAAKDRVITSLANGQTDRAFDKAGQLLANAATAVDAFEAAFTDAMTAAEVAYHADDYNGALGAVNRALALKGEDAAANTLKQKISSLPEILDLIEKARIANVENDLEEELALSREILRLDDSRTAYRERISEIESALRERQYERALAIAFDALKAENISKTETAYQQASALFPAREETKNLASQLKELKRKVTFRAFVKDGDAAIKKDDWPAAMGFYQNAAALYPDNAQVLETISLIEQILRHDAEVRSFLQQPERLSAANIRSKAEQAVKDADLFGTMSASLGRNVEALETAIVRQNREIDVWVLSDKQTSVSVRSVGQVGQVDRYKIRLKPGQYIFEGRREGYRTKSVSVTITPEDSQVEVTVISDERV